MTDAVPIIDIAGAPRERGRQQGEGMRSLVVSMVAAYRDVILPAAGLEWDDAAREARRYLPPSEAAFPHYVEELRGIAEGANVRFEDVWLLNCYEEVSEEYTPACTSLAVRGDLTADGHVLLAHNEDWISADRDHVYLVRGKPDDEPAFLGMTYGPLLVNVGLNDAGVGVAIDSVYHTDGQLGVPRVVFSRAILVARTMDAAVAACLVEGRAGGYHYLLADAHGELRGVESSAAAHAIMGGEEGWLAHTNHYLTLQMQNLQQPGTYAGSRARLDRARELLQQRLGGATPEGLQALLRYQDGRPGSICGCEDPTKPPHERAQTLVSLVMDLTERVVWAAPGSPCEGGYVLHRLSEP
jgi:isopenicillin-N N-acyltransferase-like protein